MAYYDHAQAAYEKRCKEEYEKLKENLRKSKNEEDGLLLVHITKLEGQAKVAKERINVFNSHNLGLSCLKGDCTEEEYVSLPDGIYTICLKSGYENIEETKFYLKTDRFNIEYSKVMIKDGIEYNKDFIEYMMQVKFLVEVAKSHAMLGDFVKAQRFFEDAKKKLRKYVECKNCI